MRTRDLGVEVGEKSLPRGTRGRIVLDTFRSTSDPMLNGWMNFRDQMLWDEVDVVIGAIPPGPTSSVKAGVFGVWRLLAPNNREIGRCATLFDTPADALAGALHAQRSSSSLVSGSVRGRASLAHGWVLRGAAGPIVMSPRWYEAASEAGAAARTARALLEDAILVDGVNIGTGSGRRQRLAIVATVTPEASSTRS